MITQQSYGIQTEHHCVVTSILYTYTSLHLVTWVIFAGVPSDHFSLTSNNSSILSDLTVLLSSCFSLITEKDTQLFFLANEGKLCSINKIKKKSQPRFLCCPPSGLLYMLSNRRTGM